MQIHAGNLKGRRIKTVKNAPYRPTTAIVRKSLFDILRDIEDKSFLDLFSGTGSFGIECLSRGAAEVIFFENYHNSLKILKQNIFNLKLENRSIVFDYSAYNLKEVNLEDRIFNIIFLDPPLSEEY